MSTASLCIGLAGAGLLFAAGASANGTAARAPVPFGDPCAALAALSPSASREDANAREAERWVSARVSEAIERLVTARGLAALAPASKRERAEDLVNDLYARDARLWLATKQAICGCAVLARDPPPSCADLAREGRRALCEGTGPRGGRGIDVCRLTRGS